MTRTFHRRNSNLAYPITSKLNCEARDVIYVIECRACGLQYVGETARPLKMRINNHLTKIRSSYPSTQLHRHFANACSPDDFSFFGIAVHPRQRTRLAKESDWIKNLNTLTPNGLNTNRQKRPPPSTLILPYCACAARIAAAIREWCPPDLCRIAYSKSANLGELSANHQSATHQPRSQSSANEP